MIPILQYSYKSIQYLCFHKPFKVFDYACSHLQFLRGRLHLKIQRNFSVVSTPPEAGMTRACRLCGSLSVHAVNGGREMAMVDGFGCVAAVGALIHHDGERQPSALTLSRI